MGSRRGKMKNMDAMMILAVVRDCADGMRCPAGLIIGMFADEEASGYQGCQWLVKHHPELFAGATHAISEVGGAAARQREASLLAADGEKALSWYSFEAEGKAGHGSRVNDDNAVAKLATAMARLLGTMATGVDRHSDETLGRYGRYCWLAVRSWR